MPGDPKSLASEDQAQQGGVKRHAAWKPRRILAMDRAAGEKKGGYVLGRLLHHDPDSKSAWIQTGSSAVQVTYEQLRPTYGLGAWNPDMEDILFEECGEESHAGHVDRSSRTTLARR